MTGPQSVQLTVSMPAQVAWELAQFIKRSTFTTCLDLTEAQLPHDERKRCAHLMITGAEAAMIEFGKIHLDRTAHMEYEYPHGLAS